MIRLKRVYEPPAAGDGRRFLIDALWPRGIKKEKLRTEAWLRPVAPTPALRKWFGHDVSRWKEFSARYQRELERHPEAWNPLLEAARQGDLTLVFAAKDEEHNNAVVLKHFLEQHLR